MECPTCSGSTVTAFCRECGRGVCPECLQNYRGAAHCPECVEALEAKEEVEAAEAPPAPAGPPPQQAALPPARPRATTGDPDAPNPMLAGILGFVPGLGAVYNGHYVKGLIHVVLFGCLLTLASHVGRGLEGLFVPVLLLFFLYMPIEAVRTAHAMRRGEPVDEMSGLVGSLFRSSDRSPIVGVLVIAFGVLLLLFSLEVLDIEDVLPAWPVLIIAYGAYRLYRHLRPLEQGADQRGAEG